MQREISPFLAGKLFKRQSILMTDANPIRTLLYKRVNGRFLEAPRITQSRPYETMHVQETVTKDEQRLHLVRFQLSKSMDYYGTTLKTSSPGRTRSETLTPI